MLYTPATPIARCGRSCKKRGQRGASLNSATARSRLAPLGEELRIWSAELRQENTPARGGPGSGSSRSTRATSSGDAALRDRGRAEVARAPGGRRGQSRRRAGRRRVGRRPLVGLVMFGRVRAPRRTEPRVAYVDSDVLDAGDDLTLYGGRDRREPRACCPNTPYDPGGFEARARIRAEHLRALVGYWYDVAELHPPWSPPTSPI